MNKQDRDPSFLSLLVHKRLTPLRYGISLSETLLFISDPVGGVDQRGVSCQ